MGILTNMHRVDNETFKRGNWITLSLKYQSFPVIDISLDGSARC